MGISCDADVLAYLKVYDKNRVGSSTCGVDDAALNSFRRVLVAGATHGLALKGGTSENLASQAPILVIKSGCACTSIRSAAALHQKPDRNIT